MSMFVCSFSFEKQKIQKNIFIILKFFSLSLMIPVRAVMIFGSQLCVWLYLRKNLLSGERFKGEGEMVVISNKHLNFVFFF
jgi:hypothetical protein